MTLRASGIRSGEPADSMPPRRRKPTSEAAATTLSRAGSATPRRGRGFPPTGRASKSSLGGVTICQQFANEIDETAAFRGLTRNSHVRRALSRMVSRAVARWEAGEPARALTNTARLVDLGSFSVHPPKSDALRESSSALSTVRAPREWTRALRAVAIYEGYSYANYVREAVRREVAAAYRARERGVKASTAEPEILMLVADDLPEIPPALVEEFAPPPYHSSRAHKD